MNADSYSNQGNHLEVMHNRCCGDVLPEIKGGEFLGGSIAIQQGTIVTTSSKKIIKVRLSPNFTHPNMSTNLKSGKDGR